MAHRKGRRHILFQGHVAIELGVADAVGDANPALAQHFETSYRPTTRPGTRHS